MSNKKDYYGDHKGVKTSSNISDKPKEKLPDIKTASADHSLITAHFEKWKADKSLIKPASFFKLRGDVCLVDLYSYTAPGTGLLDVSGNKGGAMYFYPFVKVLNVHGEDPRNEPLKIGAVYRIGQGSIQKVNIPWDPAKGQPKVEDLQNQWILAIDQPEYLFKLDYSGKIDDKRVRILDNHRLIAEYEGSL